LLHLFLRDSSLNSLAFTPSRYMQAGTNWATNRLHSLHTCSAWFTFVISC